MLTLPSFVIFPPALSISSSVIGRVGNVLVLKHVLTGNLVALLLGNLLAFVYDNDAALYVVVELGYGLQHLKRFVVNKCKYAVWDKRAPLAQRNSESNSAPPTMPAPPFMTIPLADLVELSVNLPTSCKQTEWCASIQCMCSLTFLFSNGLMDECFEN